MAITYPNSNDGFDNFIIGDVTLQIPPESISTFRVENNEEISALRARFPMFTKSGQSLLNVTVVWSAVVGGNDYYSQWNDLRRVVAMFRCAPFVQIENTHLRGITQIDDNQRMAFALRQMTITTRPDSPDILSVSLDLTFFNYFPYSSSFAVQGLNGKAVDSFTDPNTNQFTNYVSAWMANNFDNVETHMNTADWVNQNTGDIKFTYRTYKVIPNPRTPGKVYEYAYYPGGNDGHDWSFDYDTTENTFYYYETDINYTSGEDGPDYYSPTITSGISINLVNNFAQIPLSGYIFPTYQHLGPAATTISISLQSTDIDGDDLGQLQQAVSLLNTQYIGLKPVWKSTVSVHRMQALVIQNQILNMFGISAVMPMSFTSQTDQESFTVSANLMCKQYENVFEVLEGFRISDPTQANLLSLQAISNPAILSILSPAAQKAVSPVTDYWKARNDGDINYLLNLLGSVPSDPKAVPGFIAGLNQLPNQSLTQPVDGLTISQMQTIANSSWPAAGGQTVGQLIPGLKNRVEAGQPSYADALIISALLQNIGFAAPIESLTNIGKASNPSLQDAIYLALWPQILSGSPAAYQAAVQIQNTSQYKTAAGTGGPTANGPGSDPSNSQHGCYADFNLGTSAIVPIDFNPGYYFVDESKKNFQDVSKSITDVLTASQQAAAQSNVVNGTTYVYTNDHVALPTSITSTNNADLLSRLNLELRNPAHAYPTFKLFLTEDKAGAISYAYDDFYSYSAVQNIEVIKYQDQPDAAMITISNLAGLLNHKLYDASAEGYREWLKDDTAGPSPTVINAQNANEVGTTMSGPSGVSAKDKSSYHNGRHYYDGDGITAAPLKYYPLQTGSKIQIRMGFSNNPDKLWPVFNGIITEINEESDIISIMAQGFMLELMDIPDSYITTDQWNILSPSTSALTMFAQADDEIAAGHIFTGLKTFFSNFNPKAKAPAFGQSILGDDGSAAGVITKMVQSPAAKHFGKWQINSPSGRDSFLTGYLWSPNPDNNGLSITNTLNGLYNRSAENILTSQAISSNGTKTNPSDPANNLTRDWNYENSFSGPGQYHITEGNNWSPWDIIKDVARRYPENILTVKGYGYPWAADATLVFANPHDFYRARATSLTELGGDTANDKTDTAAFQQWWDSTGRNEMLTFGQQVKDAGRAYYRGLYAGIPPVLSDTGIQTFFAPVAKQSELTILDNSHSYEQFVSYINRWAQILAEDTTVINRIDNTIDEILHGPNGINTFFPGNDRKQSANLKLARGTLDQMKLGAANQISKSRSGSLQVQAYDLAIPVRKYHIADVDSIIHNGIKLNGNLYNAVQIGDEVLRAAESIPSQHIKVLNVNNLIVSDLNVKGTVNDKIRKSYAQSFLSEELGKMYDGELILRGSPEIEPFDIILLQDPMLGMKGPIRVKKVIHTYDNQMGFVSIVTPECLILTNETATASTLALLDYALTTYRLGHPNILKEITDFAKQNIGLTTAGATGGTAATSTLVSGLISASTLAGGTVLEAVATVGLLLFATRGLNMFTEELRTLTLVVPMPLNRYGRPWLAGVEGYRAQNFWEMLQDKYQGFIAEEFYPLLESWRTLGAVLSPSISGTSTNSTTTGANGNTINVNISVGNNSQVVVTISNAIKQAEGFFPNSRSYRNNNPGNILGKGDTGLSSTAIVGGQTYIYAVYSSLQAGYDALLNDVTSKLKHAPNGVTLNQLINRYIDGKGNNTYASNANNHVNYVNIVAAALSKQFNTIITGQTLVSTIANLGNQSTG